jgi:hypothetical protein
MKVVFSERAIEALENAPAAVQRAFFKQIRFLASNLQHPSLRAKKYDEAQDLWQARINRDGAFISRLLPIRTALKTSYRIPNSSLFK